MNTANSCEVLLEPGVAEFLKRHAAEEEFETTCELARSCFPELRDMRVFLQEDPDMDDRCWVVLRVRLPRSHPLDLFLDQERRFYEQIVERCPPAQYPDPVCCLMADFAEE
jgi:hypothetical protein